MTNRKPTVRHVASVLARVLRKADWKTWNAIESGVVVSYRRDRKTGRTQRRDEHRRWRDVDRATLVREPKD